MRAPLPHAARPQTERPSHQAGAHRRAVACQRTPGRTSQRGVVGWVTLATLAGASAATVLNAPAQWLVEPLARASHGRLVLVNAHGTVWQGQGGLVFTGGEGSQDRTALPGNVTWQLRPAWSQQAAAPANAAAAPPVAAMTAVSTAPAAERTTGPGLALTVHAACCMQSPLTVWWTPGWGQHTLHVAAHQSTWPAGLLSGLGTPWNTLQLQAGLTLATTGLDLRVHGNRWLGKGAATLDVLDASTRLSTVKPMGSYRLTWQWPLAAPGDTATAADPTLTLQTLQGALHLSGNGQWVAGRLRFEGTAEAASGREEALTNLMNLLGRRQGTRTLIKIG